MELSYTVFLIFLVILWIGIILEFHVIFPTINHDFNSLSFCSWVECSMVHAFLVLLFNCTERNLYHHCLDTIIYIGLCTAADSIANMNRHRTVVINIYILELALSIILLLTMLLSDFSMCCMIGYVVLY